MPGMSDFDRPLTPEEADTIVRQITGGKMGVRRDGEKIFLCCDGATGGDSLLPYQMTRQGVMRAVSENYPDQPSS